MSSESNSCFLVKASSLWLLVEQLALQKQSKTPIPLMSSIHTCCTPRAAANQLTVIYLVFVESFVKTAPITDSRSFSSSPSLVLVLLSLSCMHALLRPGKDRESFLKISVTIMWFFDDALWMLSLCVCVVCFSVYVIDTAFLTSTVTV